METQSIKPVDTGTVRIPVKDIVPDPNQPRKVFDPIKMAELKASVKEKDIIQALTLRPYGKGYMIISGERRWRVAKELELLDVPATIRIVNDAEARQMQIIENLQREDVGPMEQATAFKTLTEESNMSVEDIATQVGKPINFVRQQLKLNDLTPKWQNIFGKNGIPITTALQICVLPLNIQKELYTSQVSQEDEKSDNPRITINQYTINQCSGFLSNAKFDINNPNLDKKAGACSSCSFNSACYSLFSNDVKNPKCNNVVCFRNKTNIHFENEFQKAKEDPTILMVYSGYSKPEIAETLKKDGFEVLKIGYGEECKEINPPTIPMLEEYQKQGKERKLSEKKIAEEFNKAKETYDFQKEVFDKRITAGKYKKAFYFFDNSGQHAGTYTYVEITKKSSSKTAKETITSGNATSNDIAEEIQRVKDRQTRALELDKEKIHKKIAEAVLSDKSIKSLPKASCQTDTILLHFLLTELLSLNNKEAVQRLVKPIVRNDKMSLEKWSENLKSLSKPQISFLIRQIIIDRYSNALPHYQGGHMFRLMAEGLGTIPITNFVKEQAAIAEKRAVRVEERLKELTELKEELKKEEKKASGSKKIGKAESKKAA
jgi:ParB family transcriptional regulator, chromosome partitioning protein